MRVILSRNWDSSDPIGQVKPPNLLGTLPILEEKLKQAYRKVTEGKFSDALNLFVNIIHSITLLSVETRREVDEVKELLAIARDYAVALRIELSRKEVAKSDPNRAAELAAFPHQNYNRFTPRFQIGDDYLLQDAKLQTAWFSRRLLKHTARATKRNRFCGGKTNKDAVELVRFSQSVCRLFRELTPNTEAPNACSVAGRSTSSRKRRSVRCLQLG